jgi:hypothetical protein
MARIEEVCGGVDQSWFSIDLHFPIHKKMFFVQTNGAFVSSISIMLLQERCWFQDEYNVQSLSALLVSFSLINVSKILVTQNVVYENLVNIKKSNTKLGMASSRWFD